MHMSKLKLSLASAACALIGASFAAEAQTERLGTIPNIALSKVAQPETDPFAQHTITGLSKYWISPLLIRRQTNESFGFLLVNPHASATISAEIRCYGDGLTAGLPGSGDVPEPNTHEIKSYRRTLEIKPRHSADVLYGQLTNQRHEVWCGVLGSERFMASAYAVKGSLGFGETRSNRDLIQLYPAVE